MKAQAAIITIVLLRLSVFAAVSYDVTGHIEPATQASVSLHGASTPFAATSLSDSAGKFQFNKIDGGTYTVIVFVPGRGATRTTIDVGPGTANPKGRVDFTVRLDESRLVPDSHGKVSLRELSIPKKAVAQYAAADRSLAKKDTDAAVAHLQRAVELAPGFSAAWNHLGTIAYKSARYEQAAECFRKSLEADPSAYEPLVNLGGVLLNLGRVDEAWNYNVHAVLKRPSDALAHSQLGMTYFEMNKADLALRYLNEARRLDPGHFSHPQLLCAEIYLRRKQYPEAAAVLEEFLRYHPDWPQAEKMRENILHLRR